MRRLLFFHAPWCPPCRFYEKQFMEPLEMLVGKNKIRRINAQNAPFTAERYEVERLPTVILLDGDTEYMRRTGAINVNEVANWLKGGSD